MLVAFFCLENTLVKPCYRYFVLYEITVLNLTRWTVSCCVPRLCFPPSNGMCSFSSTVCTLHLLINTFLRDRRDRGKCSEAQGLPWVHTVFVQVRSGSVEAGEVQRVGRKVNERGHIHQNKAAWGFYCSLPPFALRAWWVTHEIFIAGRNCVGAGHETQPKTSQNFQKLQNHQEFQWPAGMYIRWC